MIVVENHLQEAVQVAHAEVVIVAETATIAPEAAADKADTKKTKKSVLF
jgi:hypothetical protein